MAQSVVLRSDRRLTGIKVFTATMHEERARLGDKVTDWIAAHPQRTLLDITITQSSDSAFHCISFIIAYTE